MQRRQGRGQAYISPPGGGGDRSPLDDSKSSRRSFGVPNRLWLVLLAITAVLGFTHFILLSSSSSPSSQPAYSNSHLEAKNYFNVSTANLGPNPFEFCPSNGDGDVLGEKYGPLTLSQSRSHLGTGARVQRLLHKALAGQPVTMSIIGGSVSACHGAGDDPISSQCYPSRFFQWWNKVFPHPATELTNGAMRRTNSGYFGFCNSHHLPDLTDLVIIELDTDDAPTEEMTEHFETLVRSILIRPDQPAVLILGHFAPQIHATHGFAGPDHWHNSIAQFYDVPHITIKPALFPSYMKDPHAIDPYFVDPILASPAGHEVLADMLVAYFQNQICVAWEMARSNSWEEGSPSKEGKERDPHGLFGGVGQRKGVPEPDAAADAAKDEDTPADDAQAGGGKKGIKGLPSVLTQIQVPSSRMNTKPNADRPFVEIAPFCVSANDLINPLPPSLFYGSGWSTHHPPPTSSSPLSAEQMRRGEDKHYWGSILPTSKIRIPIQVGAGDIAVFYLKEPVSVVGEGSSVECWVDDNYAGAKVVENAADVGEAQPALMMIDHFVSRGSHFVECQLLGEEGQSVPMFKLLGVFST